jgi:hypothetical protein
VIGEYKSRLLKTDNKQYSFSKSLLNYKLEFKHDEVTQEHFCEFLTELDVDSIWLNEIMRCYGSAAKVPLGQDGKRIIKTSSYKKQVDTILLSPQRYQVDQMILEGLPEKRIAKYCREKLKIKVQNHDISLYKKIFFNLRTSDIEDKLKIVELEMNTLKSYLSVLDSGTDCPAELGEKIFLKEKTEKRIGELNNSIKTLNMLYSQSAFGQARSENKDFETMFSNVIAKSYERFNHLDQYKDRDVVKDVVRNITLTEEVDKLVEVPIETIVEVETGYELWHVIVAFLVAIIVSIILFSISKQGEESSVENLDLDFNEGFR